jgi:hypothetical protein
MCVKLLENPSLSIIEKASQNLIGFIQISTMTKNDESKVFFYPKHLPSMFKALEQNKNTVSKRVLKCILWGLNLKNSTLELNANEKKILKEIAEENGKSEDQVLKTAANELKKLIG